MAGTAKGGDDILQGGSSIYILQGGSEIYGGPVINTLYGDAYSMSGNAQGGNDFLRGGVQHRPREFCHQHPLW